MQLLATLLNEGVSLPEAMSRVPGADLPARPRCWSGPAESTGTLARARSARRPACGRPGTAWGANALRIRLPRLGADGDAELVRLHLYFIVPKFEAIFKDFGVGAAAVHRLTIEASHFVIRYSYIVGPFASSPRWCSRVAWWCGLLNGYALWWDVPVIDCLFRRRHSSMVLRARRWRRRGEADPGGARRPGRRLPVVLGEAAAAAGREDVNRGRDWLESLLDRSLLNPADAAVLDPPEGREPEWAFGRRRRRRAARLPSGVLDSVLFPLLVLGLGAVVFLFAVAYFSPLVRLVEALAG